VDDLERALGNERFACLVAEADGVVGSVAAPLTVAVSSATSHG